MSSNEYSFLFSSPGSRKPNTTRKVHIRRLYDILHLCIQRQDWTRARHAWAILARCKEVNWKAMWTTSVLLIGEECLQHENARDHGDQIRFLRIMMRQHPNQRESILKELVLRLIHASMYKKALEELDLYLPSYPYQDSPALHVYAGLITLYLAQPEANTSSDKINANMSIQVPNRGTGWDLNLVRDARVHLERARILDPSNVVAEAFLHQLPGVMQPVQDDHLLESDDEEEMRVGKLIQAHKRTRT